MFEIFVEQTPNKERLQTKQRRRDQLQKTLDAWLKHMLLSLVKNSSAMCRDLFI